MYCGVVEAFNYFPACKLILLATYYVIRMNIPIQKRRYTKIKVHYKNQKDKRNTIRDMKKANE